MKNVTKSHSRPDAGSSAFQRQFAFISGRLVSCVRVCVVCMRSGNVRVHACERICACVRLRVQYMNIVIFVIFVTHFLW
jgi:hypothetical protein